MVEGQDCIQIPAIIQGRDEAASVKSCAGSFFHDAYRDLTQKVAKVETTYNGEPDSGTAFFVKDGTHMVTNAHVVRYSPEVRVEYQGKRYDARVEKLDDKNDLAELKILGLDADPKRSIKVGPVDLTAGDPVVSVGVPGIENHERYLNPGVLAKSATLYDILNSPNVRPGPELRQIQDAYNGPDPALRQDAAAVADSPRLILTQGAKAGESGSPEVNATGDLVGVLTTVHGNNVTLAVPYTKVQDLINSPDPTFDFKYPQPTHFALPDAGTTVNEAGGLAVGLAGALGKGRIAPLAYAGVRSLSLASEINQITGVNSPEQKADLGVKIAEDTAMIGGAAAASIMWKNPVGRMVGIGVMGTALASRFYHDSQQKDLPYVRKDGSGRQPWEIP